MKKLILILILLTNCLLIKSTFANIKNKNNISNQPVWGPVGYDYVEYYYLPEIEIYYSVKKKKFIFFENGIWMSRNSIPARCFGYNLYTGRVIVMNGPKPYLHHKDHSSKFPVTANVEKQQIIRDCHEVKYMGNKNHPEHLLWLEITGNDRRKNMNLL